MRTLFGVVDFEVPARWFYTVVSGPRLYTTPESTKEWMKIDPQWVDITQLHTTQNRLDVRSIIGYYGGWRMSPHCVDKVPHCVVFDNKLWVNDGNHRIAAAKLRGRNKVLARVWNID